MTLPDVGKSSFLYNILYWLVYLYFNLYYRRFSVTGRENIPADKPVIFAGNHQNALMDALSILFAAHGKVVFLARADLFRRKFIARILFFLRILPVYRIRDGISSMGQNEESFRTAAEVLKNRTPLALFPEGNHAGFKRLRSLKKGICRIAFMALEKSDYTLDLYIVPAGIDYSNYSDPGSKLLVNYGKPIRVMDFVPQYKENPQRALVALKEKLTLALEPLMINIASEDHYPDYLDILSLYRYEALHKRRIRNTHHNRVLIDKELIAKLNKVVDENPAVLDQIKSENNEYRELLNSYGLRDGVLQRKSPNLFTVTIDLILSLITLPIYLYGLVFNYFLYKLPLRFTRNVKDPVFHSSIHFGVGLLLFPLAYLILFVISLFITPSWLWSLLFLVSLPLTGIFTFYYYIHLLKLRGRIRLLSLKLLQKEKYQKLKALRSHLSEQIRQIIETSKP